MSLYLTKSHRLHCQNPLTIFRQEQLNETLFQRSATHPFRSKSIWTPPIASQEIPSPLSESLDNISTRTIEWNTFSKIGHPPLQKQEHMDTSYSLPRNRRVPVERVRNRSTGYTLSQNNPPYQRTPQFQKICRHIINMQNTAPLFGPSLALRPCKTQCPIAQPSTHKQ